MPQTTQPCASSHVVVGGATSAGTIINGGLGVDTFMPGTGYDGGDHYVASSQDRRDDEFYWRSSAGGKGVSNFGETIYRFNIAQGDDLNLSEFATAGFARVRRGFAGANDLVNWVNLSLTGTGDTVDQFDKSGSGNFTQTAVTLKNDSLFADFGVTDHSSIGVQQVVQDMYSIGHLVLSHTD
jgi:hypothetical protein